MMDGEDMVDRTDVGVGDQELGLDAALSAPELRQWVDNMGRSLGAAWRWTGDNFSPGFFCCLSIAPCIDALVFGPHAWRARSAHAPPAGSFDDPAAPTTVRAPKTTGNHRNREGRQAFRKFMDS